MRLLIANINRCKPQIVSFKTKFLSLMPMILGHCEGFTGIHVRDSATQVTPASAYHTHAGHAISADGYSSAMTANVMSPADKIARAVLSMMRPMVHFSLTQQLPSRSWTGPSCLELPKMRWLDSDAACLAAARCSSIGSHQRDRSVRTASGRILNGNLRVRAQPEPMIGV